MKDEFILKIGGKMMGTIRNLQEDFPHLVGDFEPAEGFESFGSKFLAGAEYLKDNRVREYQETMDLIFGQSVDIISSDGSVTFTRTGNNVKVGEIATIWVQNGKISFRVLKR